MTSRQRLLAALRCQPVDRVPVAPFGFGRVDPDGEMGRRLLRETDLLVPVGSGFGWLGPEAESEQIVEGDVTTTILHTPKGDLRHRVKRTAFTSAPIEYFCKNAQDVERWLSIPFTPREPSFDGYHDWVQRAGEEALVMGDLPNGVCLPAAYLSPEDFCLMWADAPDVLKEFTAEGNRRLLPFVEKCSQAGIPAFRIVGGEYVTVQLGPRAVDELLTPFDTELIAVIHRHGGLTYYHNHGPIMRWLEPLADLGTDALEPVEAPPWGDCDLAEAQRRIGGRVCLVGNLDDMEIIDRLPAAEVKRIARERLQAAGASGFILGGTASGTYTERAAAKFIEMVRVAEEFGAG